MQTEIARWLAKPNRGQHGWAGHHRLRRSLNRLCQQHRSLESFFLLLLTTSISSILTPSCKSLSQSINLIFDSQSLALQPIVPVAIDIHPP